MTWGAGDTAMGLVAQCLGINRSTHLPRRKQEAPVVDGSAMSVHVLCSVGYSGGKERGTGPFQL